MKKIIVYGAGAYAELFYYEVDRTKTLEIVAFVVDDEFLNGENSFLGKPLIALSDCLKRYPKEMYDMIVMVGQINMRNRKRMYENAKEMGYKLINYISPNAIVEQSIEMGENNIILPGAFIGFKGKMGNNNFIRQNVYLGHEFVIGDHNMIASGCTIGGNFSMGSLNFLALGTTIINSICIGSECLIGAGSVVVKNIPNQSKGYGNPIKIVESTEITGVVVPDRRRIYSEKEKGENE